MGRINTILFSCKVNRPENNRLFRICRSHGRVTIQYRNLRVELAERDFRKCVAQLRTISRRTIEEFEYSKDNHAEALCFLGLRARMAEANTLAWENRPGNQFVFKYRHLEVATTASEGKAVETHVARAKPPPARRSISLKAMLKHLRSRVRSRAEPMLYERLSVDLCENIHLHFQNIRVEFDKQEFLHLWDLLSTVDANAMMNGQGEILRSESLPEATQWDDRLQLEEQVEGHFHLHYRNLRIEFADFEELGVEINFDKTYSVDADFHNQHSKRRGWKLAGIRSEAIANLKAYVYTSTGFELREVKDSPIYQALVLNDPNIYNRYRETVLRANPDCHYEWGTFQSLKGSIERDGYNENHLIVIKGSEKRIVDGQHRACILACLYGDQRKVKVAHYK